MDQPARPARTRRTRERVCKRWTPKMDTTDPFPVSMEDLHTTIGCTKSGLYRYLKKHFEEGEHFVRRPSSSAATPKKWGGHNALTIFARDKSVPELVASSYNLQHRYAPHQQATTIMSLENQTIGFICSSLGGGGGGSPRATVSHWTVQGGSLLSRPCTGRGMRRMGSCRQGSGGRKGAGAPHRVP